MISQQDILNARILIVDDQQYNVLLLEQILQDDGYTSYASTMDPTQVCALHRKHRILLDLHMPVMDGFEV
jgi:putative two-component system response regulator